MAMNRLFDSRGRLGTRLIAIAVVTVFAVIACFITRPEPSLQSLSPLSGLMSLKVTAQDSTPYEVAIANQKPTLVEFYADWCTTCQAMAPTLQSIHQQMGDQVNFVMLNIDDPQWLEQIRQFQVSGVPHFALLSSEQALVDTFIGKVPKQVIAKRVVDLLA